MMNNRNQHPLRYNISSWSQLSQCMSNNSRNLRLHVSEIIQDSRVQGTVIRLEHIDFGVLFAYLIGGYGSLLSPDGRTYLPELTTAEILSELARYGFDITYNPQDRLDGDQLNYLMKLNELGYQKMRILNVYSYSSAGEKEFNPIVVAFNIEKNPMWINNGYSASKQEFTESLTNGSAINVSAISESKHYKWDWLTFVASIDDILRDNM